MAAYHLQRIGLRVLLIERLAHPRYKTCGAGITARAARLLPFDVREVSEQVCSIGELGLPLENLRFEVHRTEPLAYMSMRSRLDFRLWCEAERAGVTVVANCALRRLRRHGDLWNVETGERAYSTTFVVGADGAQSVVAKLAGFPDDRNMAPALEYEVTVGANDLARFAGRLVIDFDVIEGGYGWVFPKAKHLSIGVARFTSSRGDLNRAYHAYLSRLRLTKIESEERHGYMIPIRPRRLLAHDGIFLVGDAAGFADAITGEGIGPALESAQCLADAFAAARQDREGIQRAYLSRLGRGLLPQLRSSRLVAKVFYGMPGLRNGAIRRNGQRLAEGMYDVIAGNRDYPTLGGAVLALMRRR